MYTSMRTIIMILPFEKIQTVELIKADQRQYEQCQRIQFFIGLQLSAQFHRGDNSVIVFDVDKKTGLLEEEFPAADQR